MSEGIKLGDKVIVDYEAIKRMAGVDPTFKELRIGIVVGVIDERLIRVSFGEKEQGGKDTRNYSSCYIKKVGNTTYKIV